MHYLFYFLAWVVQLYSLLIWARLIIEFVVGIAPTWRPSKGIAAVFEVVFTLTDPPVKAVRSIVKPLRIGNIMLDFSLIVVLFALGLVRSLLIWFAGSLG